MPQIIPAVIAVATSVYSSSQQKKQAESAQRAAEEQAAGQREIAQTEGQVIKAAGVKAGETITAAGQPTAEELARQERYRTKATTPGETLLTQAGPISMAVARRIQERVETPGMDYDPATTMEVLGPELWRGLKARGIAPRPGSEPGLGGQQYMKGALPYLAQLREGAISRDISRGAEYGAEARKEQQYYETIENILSEAIRERLYQSGIIGAEAEQRGVTTGGQTIVGGTQATLPALQALTTERWRTAAAGQAGAEGDLSSIILDMLQGLGGGTQTPTKTPKGPVDISGQPTPYERQLSYQVQRRGY